MEGVAAAQSAFDVIDRPQPSAETVVPPTNFGIDPRRDVVTVDDVSVLYDDRAAPSLDRVTLALGPGEHMLVTGPSGSGKSTLLAVLLRLVPPTSGTVRVGGVPIESFDADAWRTQIAWLPQRPHLFAGSIADNIALGAAAASRADVRHAAALAGADTFVRDLPDGYDTMLAERGLTLSTGQRQRIALARVLLRDAPLVLLDEPTAHLDADNARIVHTVVTEHLADRTVVWVSHASVPEDAVDRVVRLEGGRVRTPDAAVLP
jgi:ABC-type multidrug transport system fused ATPase/permease subunit